MLLWVGLRPCHPATQQVKTWPLPCHLNLVVPEEVHLNTAAAATARHSTMLELTVEDA